MDVIIDHGSRDVASADGPARVRYEVSAHAGDQSPHRCGYRRVGVWRSPLLGHMVRWARDFTLSAAAQPQAHGDLAVKLVPLTETDEV